MQQFSTNWPQYTSLALSLCLSDGGIQHPSSHILCSISHLMIPKHALFFPFSEHVFKLFFFSVWNVPISISYVLPHLLRPSWNILPSWYFLWWVSLLFFFHIIMPILEFPKQCDSLKCTFFAQAVFPTFFSSLS